MLDRPLVFLDLETTGATLSFDRITEIGLIEVEHGRLKGEWSTLVNPETRIPPFIEALTGISNDMVAVAPTFAEIARALRTRLEGKLLVAHNARFDYGFLKNEFRRLDMKYRSDSICTVKLSRKLFPGHARHNLDTLMQRHDVTCNARHRALGDARVLWDLTQKWRDEVGAEALGVAAAAQIKAPTLPPELSECVLDEIPETPGVYLFYGENNTPLYVGKSVNLRSRVLAHFAGDHPSSTSMRIRRQLKRIDWKETAGLLGALLEAARLVKELLPIMNRNLQRNSDLCALSELKREAWPFKGRIGVRESIGARSELHVLDDWCYLGTVRGEHELAELDAQPSFDPDTYRILQRFLSRSKSALEIVPMEVVA